MKGKWLMPRTEEQWIGEYKKRGALWIHDGILSHPHALLTSGKHSTGFFNSRLVIPDEALMNDAAADLLALLADDGSANGMIIDGVVGPATGATKLAELIARHVSDYTGDPCFSVSPKKYEHDSIKSMVFTDEELDLIRGKSLLLCDDVVTTSGSVQLTADAATSGGARVHPFILPLVNRSGLQEVNGRKIIALINRPMPMWESSDCPLCPQRSEALRPKENWARLNAD